MRQQYADARRLFTLARRFAVSRRVAAGEGDALCGLALLHCHRSHEREEDSGHQRDQDRKALELFAQAVKAYEPGSYEVWDLAHVRLPLWVETREYQRAALLGRVLLAGPCSPGDALVLAPLLARAAAALGWELTYEGACHRAAVSLGQIPHNTPYAESLLDLARAHGALAFWPRAELAAEQARVHARRTGDPVAARIARQMLRAIGMKQTPRRVRARLFPDQAIEGVPDGQNFPPGDPVRVLVASFRRALARGSRR
jgi:hypothetical protein